MRVLLTRPLDESRAVAAMLEGEEIEALVWPLTRIVPTETELTLPASAGGLLFTSANGVRALAALTERRDLPALCVGQKTAEAARLAGYLNCFSADGDAHALAELARRSGIREFFHPRGCDAAGDLVDWLAKSGQRVTEAVLYQAQETGLPPAPIVDALRTGAVDVITVWSRRNGEILARHLAAVDAVLVRTDLVAISAAAAAPLTVSGFRHEIISDSPTLAGMMSAIRRIAA